MLRLKKLPFYALIACSMSLVATKCEDDDVVPQTVVVEGGIDVPSTYSFESRFGEGLSSVSYGGQVVRNLLVADIKKIIDNEAAATSPSPVKTRVLALFNREDSDDANTLINTTPAPLETKYSAISSGKNLSGKIATDAVKYYGDGTKTPETLITEWLDQIDANIANGATGKDIYITGDLVDINQMINKLILGSVIYFRGSQDYLIGLENRDNSGPKGEALYTDMEHGFDEAFGYYGASRSYGSFTDTELKSKPYKDIDGDGAIDFQSEYNFGFSTNAGKRDAGAVEMTDFTKDAFDAFLACRTAITNERSNAEIAIFARSAHETWEKVIAATVIHYINDTKNDLDDYDADPASAKANLAKHYGEMKAFGLALAYGGSEYRLISDADLTAIHEYFGDAPNVTNISSYKSDLDKAAEIMRLTYNFAQGNVANWRPVK